MVQEFVEDPVFGEVEDFDRNLIGIRPWHRPFFPAHFYYNRGNDHTEPGRDAQVCKTVAVDKQTGESLPHGSFSFENNDDASVFMILANGYQECPANVL
jgi:hypothetical protein